MIMIMIRSIMDLFNQLRLDLLAAVAVLVLVLVSFLLFILVFLFGS